nr:ribonuclease H-like domain-containing protein [Tanacetum cinerariifolium]
MASCDQQWYVDTVATSHLSSHTVRKFTTDNKCSIDFDPYGFTVRDYHTRQTLLRCDNTGDLYPLHVAASAFAILTNNHSFWHQRLGHPNDAVIHTLSSCGLVSYNKQNTQHLYRACQLDDNLDTSPIALRLLTTPTSLQQTPPQITPHTNPQTTQQSTPPTPLSTPSPQTTSTPPTTHHHHHHPPRNTLRTPIDTEKKLGPEGSSVTDPTSYRSLLFRSTRSQLIAYSDADWAGFPATRRSTSVYCVFLGDNLLTWSSKRQNTLSRSSAEAEYRGVANPVAETSWIRNLLRELHTPLFTATLV